MRTVLTVVAVAILLNACGLSEAARAERRFKMIHCHSDFPNTELCKEYD